MQAILNRLQYLYNKKLSPKLPFVMAIFGVRIKDLIIAPKYEYIEYIENAPRVLLYYGAGQIIKDKPLFGEGPGTYGSWVSVLSKSKIYQRYKIPIDDRFKMDTYWAHIIGEFGIVGTILFLLFLILIIKKLTRMIKKFENNKILQGLTIGYIIVMINGFVGSIVAPVFEASLTAFLIFSGIGMLMGIADREN